MKVDLDALESTRELGTNDEKAREQIIKLRAEEVITRDQLAQVRKSSVTFDDVIKYLLEVNKL